MARRTKGELWGVATALLVLIVHGQPLEASSHHIMVFSGGIADIDVSDGGVRDNLDRIVHIGDRPYDFGEMSGWGGPFHDRAVGLADLENKAAVLQLCITNCPPCIDASNMFSMAFGGGGQHFPNRWDLHSSYLFGLNAPSRPTEVPDLEDLVDRLVVLDFLIVRELVGVQNHSTQEEASLYYQFGAKGFVGRLWNDETYIPDALFPPSSDAIFVQERAHFDISFSKSVEQFAELSGVSLQGARMPKTGSLPGSDHISVLYDKSTEPQTGAGYDMAIAYGGKPFPNRPFVPRFIYVDRRGKVRANVVGTTAGPVVGSRVAMARTLAVRDTHDWVAEEFIDHVLQIIDALPEGIVPEPVESDLLRHLDGALSSLTGGKPLAACRALNAAGLIAENAYMYQLHPLVNNLTRPVITRDEVTFEIILDIADAIRTLGLPLNCKA